MSRESTAPAASEHRGPPSAAAHTLKSNAATFGASELADRSRSLETAAKAGEPDGGETSIDAVAEELGRVHVALRATRTALGSRA